MKTKLLLMIFFAFVGENISAQTCTNWAVTPNSQNNVPASGGNYSAQVNASGSCSYNTTYNNSWLHWVSNSTGGVFNYSVDANTGAPRSGTISINDVTDGINSIVILTVNQLSGITSAPTNDNCGSAVTLIPSTTCNYVSGTTYNATQSQPVPTSGWCSYIYSTSAYDVWYKFTATCPSHHIQVQGASDFAPVVEIQDGACGSRLTCDFATTGGLVDIPFTCTVGTTYYIRVYNDYATSIWATGSNFGICVTPTCASNDDCNFPISLTSGINCNYISGSTIGATQSKPPVSCPGYISPYAAYDVWYTFTAVNTVHKVKVQGSSDFTPIVVVENNGCNSTSGWCEDGLADGALVTINLSGLTIGNTYYIRVYDFDSYGHFQICVTHNSDIGINEISAKNNFTIAPNPFTSQTTISFDEEQKNTTIRIIDILGKEISRNNFKGKEFTIEKGDLKEGVYFLQVIDEDKNIVNKKIVIQ